MGRSVGWLARWKHGSLWAILLVGLGPLVSAGAGRAQMPPGAASAGNGVGSPFELAFWQSVATSEDRSQYEAYLTQYPAGTFSGLARAKIAALDRARGVTPAPVVPVAVPPAPVVPPVTAPVASVVAPAPAPQPVSVAPVAPPAVAVPAPVAPVAGVPPPVSAPAPIAAPAAVAAPVASDPYAKLRAAAAARSAAAAGAPQPSPTDSAATTARPVLAAIPSVALPDHFCSAEERNRFHETVYKPAVAIADQNNRAAIAYLDKLQAGYDARSGQREIEAANAIAREASAYKPVAEDAYAQRSAFTGLFDRIMALPIATCP